MDELWRGGPEPTAWNSGRWKFELRGDEIAEITYEGVRLLRGVRAVVRDRDWNTATWRAGPLRSDASGFRLPLTTTDFGADIAATLSVSLAGSDLEIAFEGESRADFDTNRTGLVVLHPPELAGTPLTVTHTGGGTEASMFPRAVTPHQPVIDIATLRWERQGLDATVTFGGDVFEMEDQRNWSDASFKTYSRPLSLPFPYRLSAGERISQQVIVSVDGDPRRPEQRNDALRLHGANAMPVVGLGASTAPDPAPDVAPLGDELLVELDLSSNTWPAAVKRAAHAGLPLDVRFIRDLDADASIDHAAAAIKGLSIARVAIFHPRLHISDAESVALLATALRRHGIVARVVGGSRSHFTELNRERRRIPRDLDGYTFAVTPLFHSGDGAQLVESVAMQRLIVHQAVMIADGRPVHVGPITLRPRFNNVATANLRGPRRADLREGYGAQFTAVADARQSAPELAAWTIASAAALAVPGVASLAFFEEWGSRGIRSAGGADHPVAAAVADLADLAGGQLLWSDSPDGMLWAIGARQGARTVVYLANLSEFARESVVEIEGAESVGPVHIAPYGYARLELRTLPL